MESYTWPPWGSMCGFLTYSLRLGEKFESNTINPNQLKSLYMDNFFFLGMFAVYHAIYLIHTVANINMKYTRTCIHCLISFFLLLLKILSWKGTRLIK